MKNFFFTLLILFFCYNAIYGQADSLKVEWKKFNFKYDNINNSIFLPSDFIGPHYDFYEEGVEIIFYSPDTCWVNILCGGVAVLGHDSSYVPMINQDSTKNIKSFFYVDESRNRYVRNDYWKRYEIQYYNASPYKKKGLDELFDFLIQE
jgi:hypothetical protein